MNLELYREIAAQCQNHASVSHTECGGMLWGSGAAILRLIDMVEGLEAQLAARVPDDEHAAFSRWACERTMNTRTNSAGEYAIHEVSAAWEAWQARAMLSAAPSQQAPQPTEQEAQLVLERDSARAAYDRQCRVTNKAYAKIRELEQASQQAPVAQGEPVAWTNPGAKGKTFYEIMVQAHSFCPTELPHLQKMQWMASYYEVNRQQQASEPMTVEQIWENDQLMTLNAVMGLPMQTIESIVGIVERHHNIKGSVSHA